MTKVKCDVLKCFNNENGFCMTDFIELEFVSYEGLVCHQMELIKILNH